MCKGAGPCCCPGGSTMLEADIDFLVEYHGVANVSAVFEFMELYFTNTLPAIGRPRNLMLLGVPGAGKSTLTDLIRSVIPGKRTFEPVLNSTTPFSQLGDTSLLCAIDDFRFSNRVPISSTLQWLEGRPFGCDVKNKEPRQHTRGPVWMVSANYADNCDGWKPVDVAAFKDRFRISYMNFPVPKEKYISDLHEKMKSCTMCRVKSMTKRCNSLKKVAEQYIQETSPKEDPENPKLPKP